MVMVEIFYCWIQTILKKISSKSLEKTTNNFKILNTNKQHWISKQYNSFTLTATDKTEVVRTVTNRNEQQSGGKEEKKTNEIEKKRTLTIITQQTQRNEFAPAYVFVCHKTVACCVCLCKRPLLPGMLICTVFAVVSLSLVFVAAKVYSIPYILKRILTHCTTHTQPPDDPLILLVRAGAVGKDVE